MKTTNNFVASLHTHVRSIFDAFISPQSLCDRIKQLGGKGCAITDHGVVSSIEDYKAVFKENGLKMVPGCELYVDGDLLGRLHLVVLAKNDRGWKGICKIVTESNRNLQGDFPVITQEQLFEIMKQYKGDIIALSACMQGVISAIFLLNDIVERKIEKEKKTQEKYINPDSDDYIKVKENVEALEREVNFLITKRDELKIVADAKFAKREKAVEKMKGGDEYESARKNLEADKEKSEKAKALLLKTKESLSAKQKELSTLKKKLSAVKESAEKYFSHEEKINALAKELKSQDDLMEMALENAKKYIEAFGKDDFYAEVQYHGIDAEKKCYPNVVKVAKELGIKLVATNDVHILDNSDREKRRRQTQKALRFGEWEEESVGDSELYLKDNTELEKALVQILEKEDVIEAIENIEKVFDKCNVEFVTGKHYPVFDKSKDSKHVLDEEVEKGIKWRFPNGMDKEHTDRIAYELEIIKSMGYADYFLVVKDFIEYGRLLGFVPKDKIKDAPLTISELKAYIEKNKWKNGGFRIGPGRGSAVGSLVSYVLGITALDPIKYGLLFERMLNPMRSSMPDVDTDFSNASRQKCIEYVQHKYGNMAVCGILTTNAQAPKGSIDIAAKYYGLSSKGEALTSLGRTIAKDVPDAVHISFKTIVDENGSVADEGMTLYEFLLKKYSDNDAQEIIKWAADIEGIFTAYGAHAAGIVISDNDDISDYLPLKFNKELDMFTTQCNMVQVEENGLLKFDFLGLKTLDIITETLYLIEKNTGKIIDPLKINLEDENVFKEIFSTGKTNSVFQFESSGMKSMLKRFKPKCFEDIIILVSMFRPGPMQYLDSVIDVKNGVREMSFLCPQLEPILGKTYGAIVYQEQVMEICQKLAGFTLGHADEVRRFMSKKKDDKLAKERPQFVSGCKKNEISEEVANTLFDQMMDFAKYAFNKSHAAAYALIAYITAWLKYYYPAEFFASALNWADKIEKIAGLMYEAANCGVTVLAPNINVSEREFTVKNGKIRFGLSSVGGVKSHADAVIEERKNGSFASLKDFYLRVNPNKTVIENLISSGAFDEFNKNRKAMKSICEELSDIVKKRNKKVSFIKSGEYLLPVIEKLPNNEAVIAVQMNANLKVEFIEKASAENLAKRIENAKTSLANIEKELAGIKVYDIEENKEERMANEKSLLGMYVTEHPMDHFPQPEFYKTKAIIDLEDGSDTAYGIITDFQIKKRKSDGKEMAFFKLEDKSGMVDVAVFTKQFARIGKLLEEGRVIVAHGRLNVTVENEGREDESEERQFILEDLEFAQANLSTYIMKVSSLASFHLDIEEMFRDEYEQEDGHPLIIYDKVMDEMREMNYRVSEDVKKLPSVEEM